ncbi:MAG: heme-binding protein [Chromatiales bacterium]|nr:heme-binding protein [Chromatiales bacterium]
MKKALAPALLLSVAILAPATAGADEPLLVSEKRMSLETALRIAQGAIDACREKGIQIGVTVVDRAGNPQVMLRDVLATELTERISRLKAYTAVSFNAATKALRDRAASPMVQVEGLVFLTGGLLVQAGGQTVGAVGVSGAPSGDTDEECAQAGIDAVTEDLEFGG